MKLIDCKDCKDTVVLESTTKYCKCGLSSGRIYSRTTCVASGPCRVISIPDTHIRWVPEPNPFIIRPEEVDKSCQTKQQ